MTGEQLWDFFLQIQMERHPETNPATLHRWERIPEDIQGVWSAAALGLTQWADRAYDDGIEWGDCRALRLTDLPRSPDLVPDPPKAPGGLTECDMGDSYE